MRSLRSAALIALVVATTIITPAVAKKFTRIVYVPAHCVVITHFDKACVPDFKSHDSVCNQVHMKIKVEVPGCVEFDQTQVLNVGPIAREAAR